MATTYEYPVLPDYEELPPPQPIQQATADEAGKQVLESMVDLYEWSGGGSAALAEATEEFLLHFIQLAYYIMRHEKAQAYCASQPAIVAELRRYTAYLLSTTNSIYWTLCDFDYCLAQLGA
jgi:hypothetical protein